MTDLQNEALSAIETQAGEPQSVAEGFAIVGYAARFPGAADADEFWDVLRQGRDAISEVPEDRWDLGEFLRPRS